jgi:hypothetical protein
MNQSVILRKANNFLRRPGFERAWYVPAWLLLGLSRLIILCVPFRLLAPWLGRQEGISPWVPLVGAGGEAKALAIARVVAMAVRHTPWASNCYTQALAARIMLGIYGVPYCLYFGVERASGHPAMKAHAWVVSGRVQVCGGASFGQFTVTGCFVAPALAASCEAGVAGP